MSNKSSFVKYAAVASAVAAACAGSYSFAAATITPAAELAVGRQTNTASAAGTDFNLTGTFKVDLSGTSYVVGDTVSVSVTGASLRTGTGAATGANVTCTGAAAASTLVLGFLSRSASALTYRVSDQSTGLTASAFSCTFPTAQFSITRNSATTVGACSVKVGFQITNSSGTATFDVATAAGIVTVIDEFSARVVTDERFSGTVDVSQDRRTWTAGNSRTLTITVQSNSGVVAGSNFSDNSQNTHSIVITGAGNGTDSAFGFLDDEADGCTLADLTAGVGRATVSTGSFSAISANCATLTVAGSGLIGNSAGTATAISVTLTKTSASAGLAIADGSFSVSPTFTVTIGSATSSQAISTLNGGSFGINGTAMVVPYMPYGLSAGQTISQVFSLTNRSTTAGAVTGTVFNQAGSSCSLGTVGTASARSVTNLSSAINAAIAGCYAGSTTAAASAFPSGTRVYITLTSNTPAASTELTSTYNVNGDSRVNVINDSQKVRTTN
jgi:hypothetical protein